MPPTKPRRDWPPVSVVIAALGLLLIHSWLAAAALAGTPLGRGRLLMLTPGGKILVCSAWFLTVFLLGIALYPSRD